MIAKKKLALFSKYPGGYLGYQIQNCRKVLLKRSRQKPKLFQLSTLVKKLAVVTLLLLLLLSLLLILLLLLLLSLLLLL